MYQWLGTGNWCVSPAAARRTSSVVAGQPVLCLELPPGIAAATTTSLFRLARVVRMTTTDQRSTVVHLDTGVRPLDWRLMEPIMLVEVPAGEWLVPYCGAGLSSWQGLQDIVHAAEVELDTRTLRVSARPDRCGGTTREIVDFETQRRAALERECMTTLDVSWRLLSLAHLCMRVARSDDDLQQPPALLVAQRCLAALPWSTTQAGQQRSRQTRYLQQVRRTTDAEVQTQAALVGWRSGGGQPHHSPTASTTVLINRGGTVRLVADVSALVRCMAMDCAAFLPPWWSVPRPPGPPPPEVAGSPGFDLGGWLLQPPLVPLATSVKTKRAAMGRCKEECLQRLVDAEDQARHALEASEIHIHRILTAMLRAQPPRRQQ